MKSSLIFILFILSFDAVASCKTLYSRSDYKHWKSTIESKNSNVKNVRQLAILKAMVYGTVIKDGKITDGIWYDLFTGKLYDISKVTPDGDHLVSLGWASTRGGLCATKEQREYFANDIENVWAVHPSANRKKGNRVSDYLPPNLSICKKYLDQIKLVLSRHEWIKPTKSDQSKFKEAYKKCDQVKSGILIERQKNWFIRMFTI